jgi:hypothetical protein
MRKRNHKISKNILLVNIIAIITSGCSYFGPSREEIEKANKSYLDATAATSNYIAALSKITRNAARTSLVEKHIQQLERYYNSDKKLRTDVTAKNVISLSDFLCSTQKPYGESGKATSSLTLIGKKAYDILKAEDATGFPLLFTSIFTNYGDESSYKEIFDKSSQQTANELIEKCNSYLSIKSPEYKAYEFGIADAVIIYNAFDKLAGLIGSEIADTKKVEAWKQFMNYTVEDDHGKKIEVTKEEIKSSIKSLKQLVIFVQKSLLFSSYVKISDSYSIYSLSHKNLIKKLESNSVTLDSPEEKIFLVRNSLDEPFNDLIKHADEFDTALDMEAQVSGINQLQKAFGDLIELSNDESLTLERLKNKITKIKDIVEAGKSAFEQTTKVIASK